MAKKTIPKEEWWQTPVLLKATAGLRLMPKEKAQLLLDEVRRALFFTALIFSPIAPLLRHFGGETNYSAKDREMLTTLCV